MSESGVLLEIQNKVAIIQLNNSKRANALSKFLVKDLSYAINTIKDHSNVSAVIFTGGESKAFCAGADLKERQSMSEREVEEYVALLRKTFTNISSLPMPTIAAVKGLALGGGCELALACDIRVMEKGALIGLTEVSWGIIPGAGGTQRLAQLVGIGRAKQLIFTAEKINGEKAYEIGLVEYICEAGEAELKALNIAEKISENSIHSVRLAKQAVDSFARELMEKGLIAEWDCYQKTIYHPDRLEGLAAFQEKRKPDFSNNK
jgi:methylglutaconyl-CoA hydratase